MNKTRIRQGIVLAISIYVLAVQMPSCKINPGTKITDIGMSEKEQPQKIPVTLVKHIDGDTTWFRISNTNEKVRYLAIDTQETVHPSKRTTQMGKMASKYVKDALTKATKIELEYDPNSEYRDKYGRVLAWIWIDDQLLQLQLVKNGFATVKYIYGDYQYLEELYVAQEEAKLNQLGIWHKT
ncbi:MAG: thermonuclease family protein [Lachnospiraceae bacterium]